METTGPPRIRVFLALSIEVFVKLLESISKQNK